MLNTQLHQASPDSVGYLPRTFAKKYFLDVQTRTEHIWFVPLFFHPYRCLSFKFRRENMKNIDYNYPSTIPLPGEDPKKTARFVRAYGDIFFALIAKVSFIQ